MYNSTEGISCMRHSPKIIYVRTIQVWKSASANVECHLDKLFTGSKRSSEGLQKLRK